MCLLDRVSQSVNHLRILGACCGKVAEILVSNAQHRGDQGAAFIGAQGDVLDLGRLLALDLRGRIDEPRGACGKWIGIAPIAQAPAGQQSGDGGRRSSRREVDPQLLAALLLRFLRLSSERAREHATPAQVVFRFAQAVGMLPLTGTSDPEHMVQDLASHALALSPDEVRTIESLSG